ncbi:type II secretion system protein N [Marinobacter sp.]|uniref:type II secretion system protein N n=1 Tax=Marinobacter sp. TaxID=50741 RepID=UPI001A05F62B|nr:type II secretion system protein N [Marinobacter sp.]MBE0486751.1 type II secretion system protein N [Marinobacter sp.]
MTESRPKPFLRPGKVLLLLALGLIVYGVVLVLWVPAGWVWHQASRYVQLPPQVEVRQVSGRLWDGAAGVVVAGFPARMHWQLGWPTISGLQLPVGFSLASSQSRVEGAASIGWPGRLDVTARGQIAVAEFEDLIRQSGGAMIDGLVNIDRLQLVWDGNRLQRADGLGRWDGGLVTWPMGSQTGQATFPPMQANLNTTDGGVALTVIEQGADGPAADASVLWNGMMEVRVYKRMVDLAQQPWPDTARPGDVVFRVRQPLLPGGL